jgi:hypothetical protein
MLAVCSVASVAQADLLYRQTFEGGGAITDSGWSVQLFPSGGYSGTYTGGWNGDGTPVLSDAATGDPIGGAAPGTAVYIGVGGPVAGVLGSFYVTEGSGGFENIDPATCERLILSVYANLQAGGGDDYGYFAVRMGDFDPRTADDAWYIASSPMAAPTTSAEFFDLRRLVFDPSPGNWLPMSLGSPITIGPGPVDLSGLQITGVGIVQQLTNPAPLPDFSNPEAFSSWNYSDYQINCVPEPAALVLLAVAAPAWLVLRRRTS